MHRQDLLALLDSWLRPEAFRDNSINGLQVQGKDQVRRVVCGVSANLQLFDAAERAQADAVFVHHGLLWEPGLRTLTGWQGERVRRLMRADISLYAYHLPLDAHPTLGNNAGLADVLGLGADRVSFGEYKGQKIGLIGPLSAPTSLSAFAARVQAEVGPAVQVFAHPDRPVRRVALCSGGAPDLLNEAAVAGADLYLTGEVSEWTKAIAEETGCGFVAAGHHATERFGPRRVAAALREHGLDADFVDVPNPV